MVRQQQLCLLLPLVSIVLLASARLMVALQTPDNLAASSLDNFAAKTVEAEPPVVCFIVRTYWGHGDDYGDRSLRTLLTSIQEQTFSRWEALLLLLDNRPFPELRRIVQDFNDDRIWVQAEWVNHRYAPKTKGADGRLTWSSNYHNKLYNLTDSAIRACPPTTEWVVVTNGDNEYDSKLLQHVVAAPADADIVAFDFYSRYQRPTGDPCDRFAAEPGAPMCKENEFRFCQTDLAANAHRWPRLLAEDWRFGLMDVHGDSGANDGMMAQTLLQSGWKVHRVHRCLVDHGPSPQQCAMLGHVWDDSGMTDQDSFGGRCLTAEEAADRIKLNPAALEVLKVNVTYDPEGFIYHELEGGPLPLACIRRNERAHWNQAQVFGRVCAAKIDYGNLPEDLPQHPWDAWSAEGAWAQEDTLQADVATQTEDTQVES